MRYSWQAIGMWLLNITNFEDVCCPSIHDLSGVYNMHCAAQVQGAAYTKFVHALQLESLAKPPGSGECFFQATRNA